MSSKVRVEDKKLDKLESMLEDVHGQSPPAHQILSPREEQAEVTRLAKLTDTDGRVADK